MSEHQSREADWLEEIDGTLAATSDLNGERFDAFVELWCELSRERTAATILAAMIANYDGVISTSQAMALASEAVAVVDALRAELAKAPR